MDRLLHLVSRCLKQDYAYILWTNKHRISLVVGKKVHGHGNYEYSFTTVQRYFIPKVASWYSTDRVSLKRLNQQPFIKLPSRYLKFDGTILEPMEHSNTTEFKYKQQKYYDELVTLMHSPKFPLEFINSSSKQSQIAYKSLKFLADAGINPTLASNAQGTFSYKVRNLIIKNWIEREGKTRVEMVNCGDEIRPVKFVQDVVGLWTVDMRSKQSCLSKVDCISSFDVEHIISNSYGADNEDVKNGVLLDSVVNRKKGNTLLFLADDSLLAYIRRKQTMQAKYFRLLKPWYKRYL